jgi:FixJ family two-component response regulator
MTGKVVAVVDDDESVRESLPDLLASFGFRARPYATAEAFLASGEIGQTDCLVLDVAMPGMTGPDLHRELMRLGHAIPVVFITAHSDNEALRGAPKQGVVARLTKPFSEAAMLEAVREALGEV